VYVSFCVYVNWRCVYVCVCVFVCVTWAYVHSLQLCVSVYVYVYVYVYVSVSVFVSVCGLYWVPHPLWPHGFFKSEANCTAYIAATRSSRSFALQRTKVLQS